MNILLPKAITATSFGPATTIPEIDALMGEVAWLPAGSYKKADERVEDGKIFECVQDHTATAASKPPSQDSVNWLFKAPTNRMCPFDNYLFTKARALEVLTYELKGVFVDGLALYGLEADVLEITVTAGEGGPNLIAPIVVDLWEQAFGEWEYLFGDLARGTHYTLKGLPIHPDARITITVRRNNPDVQAAVGFISIGNHKTLLSPFSGVSGVEYGAEVATKDYSYSEDFSDGTYRTVEGRKAKNINLSCVIDAAKAPMADTLLTQIAGKAVAIEVSNLPKYSHLATVGKVTGTVRSADWITARVEIQIKGNI